jgi:L-fuculose-phosphate aldolase
LLEDLKKEVLEAALSCSKQRLISGTSGNVSARDPQTGLIVITPSSVSYEELAPADLPILDADGRVVQGTLRPSSEAPLHTAVYRERSDVNGVVHTHSIYATVFSVLSKDIPAVTVPLALYGPVPVAPFKVPGSDELASIAVKCLGSDGRAVLLQNHGVLCAGKTVGDAMTCATYVEEGAQVAYLALVAGGLNPIPAEAVKEIKEKYRKGPAV